MTIMKEQKSFIQNYTHNQRTSTYFRRTIFFILCIIQVTNVYLMKEIFIYNDEYIFLGRTALHYASQNGNLDLVQFLISKNVSLVEKNEDGKNIWFLH